MNTQYRNIASILAAGILIALVAVPSPAASAEETKSIPDHTHFQSCQGCHADKNKLWEESSHGKAIRQTVHYAAGTAECSGCHSQAKPNAPAKTAALPQESNHKEACLACHSRQKTEHSKRLVMDPQKLCATCHFQSDVFLGLGAKGIEDSRNFHSGVLCYTCHMTEKNHDMKVIRPDDPALAGSKRQDSCTACHVDNNREARVRQIQEWQSTYKENMPPLQADVKMIAGALAKNPKALKVPMQAKFEDVKANLAILEKDGSTGFHNFVFMLEITSMASKDLKAIKAAIKK